MKKKNLFPSEILVQWSNDSGDSTPDAPWLIAYESDDSAADGGGKNCAVYRLVEVVDIKTTKIHKRLKRQRA